MKAEKKSKRKIRAAQIIIPPAAAALALTSCSDTGGGGSDDNDTDNVIDGASFTTPVTVAGLPGVATGFSAYKMFQPALADVDGDGDLDIFAGTAKKPGVTWTQEVIFFRNTSSGTLSFSLDNSAYNNRPSQTTSASAIGPMLTGAGDVDGDGDIDLFVSLNHDGGSIKGDLELIRLFGTTFASGNLSDNGPCYATALADLDGDNDLDQIIGKTLASSSSSYSYGKSLLYRLNDGSGTFSAEMAINSSTTTFSDTPFTDKNEVYIPSFADLDNDGDQDMFVVMLDDGTINYYENTGTANSHSFTSRSENFNLTPPGGVKWFPAFGDMDGDGDLDAMIGTSDGKILYAENVDIE
jgi:hypothetical protein